ncbi:hypothetical protein GO308_09755 [Sphingomonas sp. SFZ2018-12]|uniref:hypothetical protein n=1 Tax=Sphingomonas sp. SFZ2018-12 TaxID=2683197 RepID=UPI001F0F81B2|nr:hypothetical protein [Sphingomonas sp. SFZ2018-12]MCH4893393.1 hypothetical protein [Sphingomonas sp. SFZ2018-12]
MVRSLTTYLIELRGCRHLNRVDPDAEARRLGIRPDWARAYLRLEMQARGVAATDQAQPSLL